MRRNSLVLGLLGILLLSFSGCIDIATRYLVREDGSVRVIYDLVFDKMMLQMYYAMPESQKTATDSSIAAADSSATNPADAFAEMMKPFKLTKEIADSVCRKLFGAEISRLSKLPQIKAVWSTDSLAYDGLHLLFTTELRSYKDIALLRKPKTQDGSKKHISLSDSVYMREEGDSVLFMIADLSSLNDEKESLPEFPVMRDMNGWFKKTRYVLPPSEQSIFKETLWQPASFTKHKPKRKRPKHAAVDSLADNGDSGDESSGGTMDDGDGSDNLLGGMKVFTSLLGGLINFDMSIQSPLILSHDPASEFDSLARIASWHFDIGSVAKMEETGSPENKYYVWLRKPR